MITLTVLQILELAEFAGIPVSGVALDEFEKVTEIVICDCPPEGITNEGEPGDTESVSHYEFIAYCADCPEEGCIGLGPEIAKPEVRRGE